MEKQAKKLKICTFSKLSQRKLAEVKRFVRECARVDGYETRFYWDSIEERHNQGINEILCYEGDKIVSYLALYHFEEGEIEFSWLVEPRYRHASFYQLIWDRARHAASRYVMDLEHYRITCNQREQSLQHYFSRLGGLYFDSTYQLHLSAKAFQLTQETGIQLREATLDDVPSLTVMEDESVLEQSYTSHLLSIVKHSRKSIWIIENDQKLMGKVHVKWHGRKAFLSEFYLLPEYQDDQTSGLALVEIIMRLLKENVATIIVDAVDEYSLAWYQKFGFSCQETFEHWKLAVYQRKVREKQLDRLLWDLHRVQHQSSLYKH